MNDNDQLFWIEKPEGPRTLGVRDGLVIRAGAGLEWCIGRKIADLSRRFRLKRWTMTAQKHPRPVDFHVVLTLLEHRDRGNRILIVCRRCRHEAWLDLDSAISRGFGGHTPYQTQMRCGHCRESRRLHHLVHEARR